MAAFKNIFSTLKPAYAAALALIAIQVGIGILFKAAQTNGKYPFSPSSSVTISETLKFLLSTWFFYREVRARTPKMYAAVATELIYDDAEEGRIPSSGSSVVEEKDDMPGLDPPSRTAWGAGTFGQFYGAGSSKFDSFRQACAAELPSEVRYGFAQLALFYVLINNTVFVLFRLADPGTIQLIKSGTTLITACVSVLALDTVIVKRQWWAITLQVCGIVVTQYKSDGGATYGVSTYMLLLLQTTVSSVASVYNQKLCKTGGSMHMMNMVLYASGACINLILHIIIRFVNPGEPGFFVGYGSFGALLVILSNVFIGLIMTAVYKYADALIKCFAMAISTGILLYASPILFHTDFSFLVVPGTTVVFIATLLYMEFTPAPGSNPPPAQTDVPAPSSSFVKKIVYIVSPSGPHRSIGLFMSTSFTLFIVTLLTYWNIHSAGNSVVSADPVPLVPDVAAPIDVSDTFYSPFNKTMAFIRWNQYLPFVQEPLKAYSPYFHTVHESMPRKATEKNMTGDAELFSDTFDKSDVIYLQVKQTLSKVLEDPESTVEGLLFFHYDTWVSPSAFMDMDFNKIWFADAIEPKYKCMTETATYKEWGGWTKGYDKTVLEGVRLAKGLLADYDIDDKEFCTGWTGFWYIPRRFFKDFIALSGPFYAAQAYHEVAIPTMLQIIDRHYRPHPSRSVIQRVGDCWGSSVAEHPTLNDVLWRRCGHRFDFHSQKLVNGHFHKLKQESLLLGKPLTAGADLAMIEPKNGTKTTEEDTKVPAS